MGPIDGGDWKWRDGGKECRAAHVGGDCVRYDLVALRVLQSSDALKGDVEAAEKNRISVCMTVRRFKPTEEAISELAGLEEGAGSRAVGKRNRVGIRTVAVYREGGREVGGFG